jgi:hypothetical protein
MSFRMINTQGNSKDYMKPEGKSEGKPEGKDTKEDGKHIIQIPPSKNFSPLEQYRQSLLTPSIIEKEVIVYDTETKKWKIIKKV